MKQNIFPPNPKSRRAPQNFLYNRVTAHPLAQVRTWLKSGGAIPPPDVDCQWSLLSAYEETDPDDGVRKLFCVWVGEQESLFQ